jgi:hypothetical protein
MNSLKQKAEGWSPEPESPEKREYQQEKTSPREENILLLF